jgi:Flp pilus assembly protein TadD
MLTLSNRTNQHSPETYTALQAAEGYVFFGLHREALREIDSIEPGEQEDRDVMVARIHILLHLGRWTASTRIAARGAALHPTEEEFTVQRAFAFHQLDRSEDAARVLLEAPRWLRNTGILHYNLGCYEARWGNLHVARQCLQAAIQLNGDIKRNARKDPDLAGLWS